MRACRPRSLDPRPTFSETRHQHGPAMPAWQAHLSNSPEQARRIGPPFAVRSLMARSTSRQTALRIRAERLEARISRDQKALFQRAAALQGRTLTDFVVASAH